MALPIRPNNFGFKDSPNNPFYYPETNYIKGEYGPFIIGAGLNVDTATGVLSATGGGGGGGAGVGQIVAAPGIFISPSAGTGTVTIANTGVTSVVAGPGIAVSGSTGTVTISSINAGGTVTNVIGVLPVSVVTGSTTPVISVATATTTNSGVTTLVNNLTTNDGTKALTAAQGQLLQSQISALSVSSGLTLAGTFDATTGKMLTVTNAGSSAGFTVAANLPTPSALNNNYFVIVTTSGSYNPPNGGGPFTITQGDWLLSNATQWKFLNVGFDSNSSSTTTAGSVRLATVLETQTGTDSTTAVTPAGASATYIPRSLVTAKGTLLAGQAANTPVALPIGSVNQVLTVDPNCASGMKWANPTAGGGGSVTFVGSGNGLSGGPITSIGSLDMVIQPISPGNYTNPIVSVNCYGVITSIANGVTGVSASCIVGKGALITGTAANAPSALPVGTDGYILTACSLAANGLCWAPNSGGGGGTAIPCSCIIGKGYLIAGSGPSAPTAFPPGADGSVLKVCAACPQGVTWATGGAGTVTNVQGTLPISVATGTSTPIVSIATASTTAPGATQLVNNLTTNDGTKALTAAQGYALQQQIASLNTAGGLTLAGTFNAATGLMLTVTTSGSMAGFAVNAVLPSAATTNNDYFVIVTTGGSYDPPGAGGPYVTTQGDWFLSNGTQWNFLDVGPAIPSASTGAPGQVQLATAAQTIAGTDSTLAVTPAGAAAAYIPLNKLTGQGAIAIGTAASTAGTLGIGSTGQILVVDLACTLGVKWAAPPTGGGGTVTSVAAGAGLAGGTITTTGTIALQNSGVTAGTYTYPTITVDAFGRVTAASNAASPVLCCTVTTRGDLLAATGPGAVSRLGSGSDNQVLVACATCPTGLTWVTTSAISTDIPCACITGKGALITGTGASAPTALPVGSNGQVLVADSAQASGLRWCSLAIGGGTVTSVIAGTGLAGGTITNSGTICIPNSGVTAGCYTNSTVCVNALGIVTSAASGPAPVLCCTVTTKGDILAATGSGAVSRVGVGSNGQFLAANSACTAGVEWISAPANAIPCACITGKGALISGSVAGTPSALSVGTDGQVLVACSTAPLGICWVSSGAVSASIPCATVTGKGAIVTGTAANAPTALGVGSDGQILVACAAATTGLCWVAPATASTAIPCSTLTGKGALVTATSASTPSALTVGTDGQILVACSTAPSGLCWTANTGGTAIPCATITGKGAIVTGTTANTPAALPVGGDGCILMACAACTTGLYWTTNCLGTVTNVLGAGAICVATGTTTPVITALSASTSVAGVVQLVDNLTTNDTTKALTANMGCCLQQQLNALSISSNITLAGTLNASTGLLVTVTTSGTSKGFAVGSPLPSPVAGNNNYYVMVTTSGTYSPPGGGGPYTTTQGDWILSNGSAWQYLNVGYDPTSASTTTAGIVRLATNAETQTGTDNTIANTPAGAAATYIRCTALTGKGSILSATATSTPSALPVGSDGQILVACSASSTGLCWTSNTGGTAIPCSTLVGKGSLVAATGASTPANLSVGSDGQVLVACATATTGLCWITNPGSLAIPCATLAAKGSLVAASGANTPANLSVGTDGQVLTACAACSTGLTWTAVASPAIPCACITGKGALVTGTGASAPVALPVGADCQVLMACSSCANGLMWQGLGSLMGDTPVGAVQFFAMNSIPTGWLVADGREVSRTTYADLFTAIGTVYGAGNGSSTFNLPDLRGMFARGWDAAGGTARGCDPGRTFGSTQADELKSHRHNFCYFFAAGSNNEAYLAGQQGTAGLYSWPSPSAQSACSVQLCGGVETRPRNVAMLPCIKWQVTTAPAQCGIPYGCVTGKGALITGLSACSPTALAVGTDGQILVACSASANGLCWTNNTGGTAIPCACIIGKGALITGTAAGAVSPLTVGADGQVLVACGTAVNGLCWMTSPDVQCSLYNAKGVILAASGTSTPTALPVGTNGQILTVNTACPNSLAWTTPGGGTVTCIITGTGLTGGPITNSGTICIANTGITPGNYCYGSVTVNAQGQITAATQGCPPVLCNTVTTLGDLIIGTGNATVSRLGAGVNGTILMACATCPGGLYWASASSALGKATPTIAGAVFGCTDSLFRTTAIGCCALNSATAVDNVAIGFTAGAFTALGQRNIFVGNCSGTANSSGCDNIAIGTNSNTCAPTSHHNISIGSSTLTCLGVGCCNIAIGSCTLCTLTSGCRNVALGLCVQVPNTTGCCQLAIGYDNGQNWLTGCSDKSIRPGAGIRDCADSLGSAKCVLMSTGSNSVVWASPTVEFWFGGQTQNDWADGNSWIERWAVRCTNATGFVVTSGGSGDRYGIQLPLGGLWQVTILGSGAQSTGQSSITALNSIFGYSCANCMVNTGFTACAQCGRGYQMQGIIQPTVNNCGVGLYVTGDRLYSYQCYDSILFTRLGY